MGENREKMVGFAEVSGLNFSLTVTQSFCFYLNLCICFDSM